MQALFWHRLLQCTILHNHGDAGYGEWYWSHANSQWRCSGIGKLVQDGWWLGGGQNRAGRSGGEMGQGTDQEWGYIKGRKRQFLVAAPLLISYPSSCPGSMSRSPPGVAPARKVMRAQGHLSGKWRLTIKVKNWISWGSLWNSLHLGRIQNTISEAASIEVS